MSDAETGAETPPAIVGQLVKVMESVGVIGKGQTNKHFNYKFRGIDDAMAAVQPALIEHGVVCMPRVLSRDSNTYASKSGSMQLVCVEVEYTFTCELDGSKLVSSGYGEGADSADKAVAKAMSACFKMVLFQALCIPTEETPDADREAPQFDHSQRQAAPQATATTENAPPEDEAIALVKKCIRIAKQRRRHLGMVKTDESDGDEWDEAKKLCAHLSELIGKAPEANWTLVDARKLESQVLMWDPTGGKGEDFGDDPPIDADDITGLHKLVKAVLPDVEPGSLHAIAHDAAEMLGFKSLNDVPKSRLRDVQREIKALENKE